MTNVMNDHKPILQRWQHIAGVVLAMCFGACTPTPDESDPDGAEDLETEIDEDGAVVERSESESTVTSSPEDTAGELAAAKAGCTHIQYCKKKGYVICSTNDGQCSPIDRWIECKKDADYVCGKDWKKMKFVPKICLPGAPANDGASPAEHTSVASSSEGGSPPGWLSVTCYDETTR